MHHVRKFVCLPSIGALTLLLSASVTAKAEKVRFGPATTANIATSPEKSARQQIEAEAGPAFNRAPAPAPTISAPAVGATVSRVPITPDNEQQNWIFRDARSVEGMSRALGVESYEEETGTSADHDSVAVIQEYFDRQRKQGVPNLKSPAGRSPDAGLPAGSMMPGSPLPGPGGGMGGLPNRKEGSLLFGGSAFENTLNSENPTLRHYFRNLYGSSSSSGPGSNPVVPNAGTGTPGQIPVTTTGAATLESSRASRLDELSRRAALVQSLSEPGADSLGNRIQSPAARNIESQNNGLPTVNGGNLFERRNGVIEIPGRKF